MHQKEKSKKTLLDVEDIQPIEEEIRERIGIMKTSKKIFSLALALVMSLGFVFSFGVKVSAEGTGSITIKNPEVGQQYDAYKVFDATYNATTGAVAYTIDSDTSPWWNAVSSATDIFKLTEGPVANVKYVSVIAGQENRVITYLNENFPNGLLPNYSATGAGTPITINNVAYGYYFIKAGNKIVVTVDKVTPNAEVNDKNPRVPDIPEDPDVPGKKYGKVAGHETYAIGETADYTLTINPTVNYVVKTEGGTPEKVTKYVITDNSNGNLKVDPTSFKVTVGNETVTNYVLETTIAEDGFTITIPWVDTTAEAKHIYAGGSVLVVEYKAEVLAAAEDGTAENAAEFYYNTTKFADDTETVKNYKFELYKWGKNAQNQDVPLAGAKFALYDGETLLQLVKEAGAADTYHIADSKEIADTTVDKVTEITTNATGTFFVKGFKGDTKTYYFEETDAPEGYNKLEGKQAIVFNNQDRTGETNKLNVQNQKGSELPSTGGMGTTIFYTVGGILVAGAAVLLITKKRMEGEQR